MEARWLRRFFWVFVCFMLAFMLRAAIDGVRLLHAIRQHGW